MASHVCAQCPRGVREKDKAGIEDKEGGGTERKGRDDLFLDQTIS